MFLFILTDFTYMEILLKIKVSRFIRTENVSLQIYNHSFYVVLFSFFPSILYSTIFFFEVSLNYIETITSAINFIW